VQDPGSLRIPWFCLSTFSNHEEFAATPVLGTHEDLVPALASLITRILELRKESGHKPRTQFYTFSSGEEAALQRHLINAALAADTGDANLQTAIRTCVGALSEGATLLATSFQPILLGGALLEFLTKKGTKVELKARLERLGLSSEGTLDQLMFRIQDEVNKLKLEAGRIAGTRGDDDRRSELGQLPRVVPLKREVERLLALPIPGYWDLPECAQVLFPKESRCLDDEDIFRLYTDKATSDIVAALQERNRCIYRLLQSLRLRVSAQSTGRAELLVNEARVLSSTFMDLCRQSHLRKLFFMQQVMSLV
jgi:hypothetical protein